MADETLLQADQTDPTVERREGPTPNGGAYSIAYFRDEAGNPVSKDKAVLVEIWEFDQTGKGIYRTYGHIPRR